MPRITQRVDDLGEYLREQRLNARLSVRQLASLAGVSNPYLSQVERGLRRPSAEVLQQIAAGLRVSSEALYIRAGILDPDVVPSIEAAVAADAHLNERQRRALLDIYASFVAENARSGARAPGVPQSSTPEQADAESARKPDQRSAPKARAQPVTDHPTPDPQSPTLARKGLVSKQLDGPGLVVQGAAVDDSQVREAVPGGPAPKMVRARKRVARKASAPKPDPTAESISAKSSE